LQFFAPDKQDLQNLRNFAASTIFAPFNDFLSTDASRLTDFTKFAKFRSLNDFSRCVAIFFSLFCLANTDASRLTDFTKFAKFRSLNDFSRCVAIFFQSFVLVIASHKA